MPRFPCERRVSRVQAKQQPTLKCVQSAVFEKNIISIHPRTRLPKRQNNSHFLSMIQKRGLAALIDERAERRHDNESIQTLGLP